MNEETNMPGQIIRQPTFIDGKDVFVADSDKLAASLIKSTTSLEDLDNRIYGARPLAGHQINFCATGHSALQCVRIEKQLRMKSASVALFRSSRGFCGAIINR